MHTLARPGFRPKRNPIRSKYDIADYIGQLDKEAKQFQMAVASETLLQLIYRVLRNQYGSARATVRRWFAPAPAAPITPQRYDKPIPVAIAQDILEAA